MAPTASMPMYDWPEIRDRVDAFYASLRAHLVSAGFDAPATLLRADELMPIWRAPTLLLSQTCGLPYVRCLRDRVQLLGTPRFDLPGCSAGHYASAILVHRDSRVSSFRDLEGTVAAINGFDSQSGFAALNHLVIRVGGGVGFFAQHLVCGAHRASAVSVANKQAAVCAVDPVCWQLIQDWDRDVAESLRVLDWSERVPALPMITSGTRSQREVAQLREVLQQAFGDPAVRMAGAPLYIEGLEPLRDADYDVVAAGWRDQQVQGLAA